MSVVNNLWGIQVFVGRVCWGPLGGGCAAGVRRVYFREITSIPEQMRQKHPSRRPSPSRSAATTVQTRWHHPHNIHKDLIMPPRYIYTRPNNCAKINSNSLPPLQLRNALISLLYTPKHHFLSRLFIWIARLNTCTVLPPRGKNLQLISINFSNI